MKYIQYNFVSLKLTVGLVLTVMLTNIKINAQNADLLFKNHHKWGITGQFISFEGAEITPINNPNLNYEISRSKFASVGIVYNFLQYKNWNFKAELQFQWFGNENLLVIAEPENISTFDLAFITSTDPERLGYLPITAEYVFLEDRTINFSVGAGIGFSYFDGDIITDTLALNNILLFQADLDSLNQPTIRTSGHLSANMYWRTKFFMLQTNLTYKKSFTNFRTGTYSFTNLEVSPDINGTLEQSGDFFAVGLTFYPKRFLGLKKKK